MAKTRSERPLLAPSLVALDKARKKTRRRLWKTVTSRLVKPRSRMDQVNVGRLSRLTKDNDIVVVPGKILGAGIIDHKIVVGALSFSSQALSKIRGAGGNPMDLEAFAQKHQNTKGVKLIG